MLKRCLDCNGTGKVLGGGMIQIECETCNGSGKISQALYEKAIKRFMNKEMKQKENGQQINSDN